MIKFKQDQVWKSDAGYIRIVRLERLSVAYKIQQDLSTRDGTHHQATKKEFTRLAKSARLLAPEEAELLTYGSLRSRADDVPEAPPATDQT
jgi:hypothetical protein